MIFQIKYKKDIDKKRVFYRADEFSFDTEPLAEKINFDITINKINLTTIGEDNIVAQIWGYAGDKEWVNMNFLPPKHGKGILMVASNLSSGEGSYLMVKEDLPMLFNASEKWFCIGYPEKEGRPVEFIDDCIAVIDDDGGFCSLWIRI